MLWSGGWVVVGGGWGCVEKVRLKLSLAKVKVEAELGKIVIGMLFKLKIKSVLVC